MPRLPIFLALICISISAFGQNLDINFDNDSLKGWQGDTTHYVAELRELRLESPQASGGRSYISRLCLLKDTAQWHIRIRLNLNPSALNQALYVLNSDIPDLNGPWTGWALRIGNNGVDDGLDLLRVRNGDRTTVATFWPKTMLSYPSVAVKLSRSPTGLWRCEADTLGLGAYLPAGSVQRPEPLQGSYLGIICHYTGGNIQDKFYFDDVLAGPLYPDHEPPRIVGMKVYPNRVRLDFDEALAGPRRSAFRLDPGQEALDSLKQIGKSLWVYRHPDLPPGAMHYMRIDSVQDASGNRAGFVLPIKYLPPAAPGTLVLSEVKPGGRKLADASPAAEFVELKNLGPHTISLDSVMLMDRAGSQVRLPDDSLEPGAYALLHRPAEAAQFAAFPNRIPGVLPALNDDGDSLLLISADGGILDRMAYSTESFEEPLDLYVRSLECRLDQRECLPPSLLWAQSQSDTGSTPGLPNSVERLPAPDGLSILLWQMPDRNRLALSLNRTVAPGRDFRATIVRKDGEVFSAGDILAQNETADYSQLTITWTGAALLFGKTYRLEMTGLQGCRPEQETVSLEFGLPLVTVAGADTGTLAINEIMFDPAVGGTEFVELINPSNQNWLSLEGASLGSWPGSLPDSLLLTGLFAPLPPGSIVWLARSRRQARNTHPHAPMVNFAQASVPELYSQEGDISLRAASGRMMESVRYSRKLHHPLLAQTKGVSLERTSAAIPAAAEGAFVSAAQSAGFATPGTPNSVASLGGDGGSESLTASPAAFSPDLDGHNDYCTLALQLPGSRGEAWFYTIRIFDGEGRPIRTLADNLTGTGRVEHVWDGTDRNRARAASGPYIALAEFFTLSGKKGRAKCGLAVAPW